MADLHFRKLRKISQREKDIVYGYMKQIQLIFPFKDNPYYIIAQIIQDLCLLYFYTIMNTSILTDDEIDSFLALLRNNNKTELINFEWKIIYRKSIDGRLNDETFIKQRYENRRNILCLIETQNNDVLGGFSSTGWWSGFERNKDDKAFVYCIRSSKGYTPILSSISPSKVNYATYSSAGYYLIFGPNRIITIGKNGYVSHNKPLSNNQPTYPLPSPYHLTGGVTVQKLKDLEIFELK